MRIKTTIETINALTERMNKSNKVFFVRFGDNDIMQMTGRDVRGYSIANRPQGGNKSLWSPQMQQDIRKSFFVNDNNYLKALTLQWDIEEGMKGNAFGNPKDPRMIPMVMELTNDRTFYQPVVFHYLACFNPQPLKDWLEMIKPMKKMFIGRVKKENAEKLIGKVDKYVKTPDHNSYYSIYKLWKEIKEVQDIDIVISCAGQLSRAIAWRMWELPDRFHYIDFGSLIDLTERRKCRGWHKIKGDQVIQEFNL